VILWGAAAIKSLLLHIRGCGVLLSLIGARRKFSLNAGSIS
jgi:hypothetical protein